MVILNMNLTVSSPLPFTMLETDFPVSILHLQKLDWRSVLLKIKLYLFYSIVDIQYSIHSVMYTIHV